jgi:hypothetical protein
MPTQRFLAAVVALVLIVGVIVSLAPGQGGKGGGPAAALHFTGKVIVVSSSIGDPEYITALERFELKHIADNVYLVGKGVDDGRPDSANRGQTVWVALDDISEITEFADVDAYKKAFPRPPAK